MALDLFWFFLSLATALAGIYLIASGFALRLRRYVAWGLMIYTLSLVGTLGALERIFQ